MVWIFLLNTQFITLLYHLVSLSHQDFSIPFFRSKKLLSSFSVCKWQTYWFTIFVRSVAFWHRTLKDMPLNLQYRQVLIRKLPIAAQIFPVWQMLSRQCLITPLNFFHFSSQWGFDLCNSLLYLKMLKTLPSSLTSEKKACPNLLSNAPVVPFNSINSPQITCRLSWTVLQHCSSSDIPKVQN